MNTNKSRNRILAIVMALVMLMGMLPLTALAEDATADLEIATAEELVAFATEVTGGNNYQGKKVVLTANIDMTGVPYSPIGGKDKPFRGEFDGQGYSISHLTVTEGSQYTALFGWINSDATVKNVTLSDVNITCSGGFSAALVGQANDRAVIKNCTVSGSVVETSGDRVAGIVGFAENNVKVLNCTNNCSVQGIKQMGGIVGNLSGNATVEGCTNNGAITGSAGDIGGIIGQITGGTVSKCVNTGTINSTGVTGGVIGYMNGGTLTNSYNRGALVTTGGAAAAGGVVGGIHKSPVSYCYSAGAVTGSTRRGGAVGWNSTGTVTNCYSDSELCDAAVVGTTDAGYTTADCYAKTTAEMKLQETFVGFDFDNVWAVKQSANDGYPSFIVWDEETKLERDASLLSFDAIKGSNTDANAITAPLALPLTGLNGSSITWQTGDATAMLNSGIPLPSAEAAKPVTLTATLTLGEKTATKTFDLTVAAGEPDAEPLHILQVGDSNTEYNRITSAMYDLLQEEYGNYGYGYIPLMVKHFGGNPKIYPEGYSIAYSGAWSEVDNNNSAPYGLFVQSKTEGDTVTTTFIGSAVDVYYYGQSGFGSFNVLIDGELKAEVDTNVSAPSAHKQVVEGLDFGLHTMELVHTGGGQVSFYGADYRIDGATNRKNISNWGNAGWQAANFVNVRNDIYEPAMEMLDPDIVVLLVGTNDNGVGHHNAATFAQNLTTMVERTKAAGIAPENIWVVSTFETKNDVNVLYSYWEEAFPVVAKEQGVHYCAMGEWFGPYSTKWMVDNHHCGEAGGKAIAELIYNCIHTGEDLTGVDMLSVNTVKPVADKTGTPFEELRLPKQITVKMDDLGGSGRVMGVTWSADGYSTAAGTYTLTGTIDMTEEPAWVRNPRNLTASVQVILSDDYVEPSEPGLLLHYDFENITDSTVPNVAGDATLNGTIVGAPKATVSESGYCGSGISFEGGSSTGNPGYVEIPPEAFDTESITLSMWVKLDTIANWSTLLELTSSNKNFVKFAASTGADRNLSVSHQSLSDGATTRLTAPNGTTLTLGEWGHVTYTQEGRNAKIYLNGELVASSNAMCCTFKDVVDGAESNLAARLGSGREWGDPATDGIIDEFKIYDYVMSAAQIQAMIEADTNIHAGTKIVQFFGKQGQLISETKVKSAEELATLINSTRVPALGGYVFKGWDVLEKDASMIYETSDGTIVITAVFVVDSTADKTVEVTDATAVNGLGQTVDLSTPQSFDTRVIATAEGEVAYWLLDGAPVGFGQQSYTFYVSGNNKIKVVLVGAVQTMPTDPSVTLQQTMSSGEDGKFNLSVIAQTSVPAGVEITDLSYGVYYTATREAILNLPDGGANVRVESSKTEPEKQFICHLLQVAPNKTRYARAYMTYTLNGTVYTVYSDRYVKFFTDPTEVDVTNGDAALQDGFYMLVQNQSTWDWRTTAPADENWNTEAGFADNTGWTLNARGGFGSGSSAKLPVNTTWGAAGSIYMRKTFEVNADALAALQAAQKVSLFIGYDESPTVYLNGVKIWSATGYNTLIQEKDITAAFKANVVEGTNYLAVSGSDTTGGRYMDIGIGYSADAAVLVNKEDTGWQYKRQSTVEEGWNLPANFGNTDGWTLDAKGLFGETNAKPGGVAPSTTFSRSNDSIYLRRTFEISEMTCDAIKNGDLTQVLLSVLYDDYPKIYLNGELLWSADGYVDTRYMLEDITEKFKELVQPGTNYLAVHDENRGGGQAFDMGLEVVLGDSPL